MFAGVELVRYWLGYSAPPPPATCTDVLSDASGPTYFSLLPSILLKHVDRLVALNAWRGGYKLARQSTGLTFTGNSSRCMLPSGEEIIAITRRRCTVVITEPGTINMKEIVIPGALMRILTIADGAEDTLLLLQSYTAHYVSVYSLKGHCLVQREAASRLPNYGGYCQTICCVGQWVQAGFVFYRLPRLEVGLPLPPQLADGEWEWEGIFGCDGQERIVIVDMIDGSLQVWDLRMSKLVFTVHSTGQYQGYWAVCLSQGIVVNHNDSATTCYVFSLRDGELICSYAGWPAISDVPPNAWRIEGPFLLSTHSPIPLVLLTPTPLCELLVIGDQTVAVCYPTWKDYPKLTNIHFNRTVIIPYPAQHCCHSGAVFYADRQRNLQSIYAIDLSDPTEKHHLVLQVRTSSSVVFPRLAGESLHGPMVFIDNKLYCVPRPPVPSALVTL